MSCSSVYFNISGNGSLSVVDFGDDNGDAYGDYKDDFSRALRGFRQVFEPSLVFDSYGEGYQCKSNFIKQITLCDAIEEGSWVIPSTYAVVCYHHSGDPTDLEVVCEVGRILKELGYDLNAF